MKKSLSLLGLMLAVTLSASAAKESRFVVCDSINALLSGVKMEFLNINSVPIVSSYDGLIRFTFPKNVPSAQVMLTGEGVDTLRIVITPTECPNWIVMTRRKVRYHNREDIFYSTDHRTPRAVPSPSKTLTGKKPAATDVEVLPNLVVRVVRREALGVPHSTLSGSEFNAGRVHRWRVSDH